MLFCLKELLLVCIYAITIIASYDRLGVLKSNVVGLGKVPPLQHIIRAPDCTSVVKTHLVIQIRCYDLTFQPGAGQVSGDYLDLC